MTKIPELILFVDTNNLVAWFESDCHKKKENKTGPTCLVKTNTNLYANNSNPENNFCLGSAFCCCEDTP